MKMYAIVDTRAEIISQVFLSENDNSAIRQFVNSVASSEFICKFPEGFCLCLLGCSIPDVSELPMPIYTAEQALNYMENTISRNTLRNLSVEPAESIDEPFASSLTSDSLQQEEKIDGACV